MKKLLITLMLVSPFSFADWGDVYYCQMTNLAVVKDNRWGRTELPEYTPNNFQFKLDETEQAVVFGEKGYFDGLILPLTPMENLDYSSTSSLDAWYATYTNMEMYGSAENQFMHVSLSFGAFTMTADCEKF